MGEQVRFHELLRHVTARNRVDAITIEATRLCKQSISPSPALAHHAADEQLPQVQ
jgi:hypothetical protein